MTALDQHAAYSLMKALQRAKADLVSRAKKDEGSSLTKDDRQVLAYLRRRGSIYLLVAAIGACSEIHLGRPVPDRFRISFGALVSPAVAEEHWEPIVGASLPFVGQLDEAAESGNLRRTAVVEKALDGFRSVVRATEKANAPIFQLFRDHVIIDS